MKNPDVPMESTLSRSTPPPIAISEMTNSQRSHVLVVAFFGWLFAGLEIALFVLIHRPAMISLMNATGTPDVVINEQAVTQWFAWYQAAFLIGAASGGWVFGVMGDRLGRTRSLGLSVLCYSLFTGASYFARSPGELLVLRFLACHGIGGTWPNTVALVAEAWPAASRPFLAGILGTAANVGQVSMGLLGLGFVVTADAWRWTFLVGAAPALIGVWCLIGVPESVRWRMSRQKLSVQAGGPLRELFRPPLRSRTIMGILLGAIPVIGTAANAQWIVPWTDQVQAQQRSVQQDVKPQDSVNPTQASAASRPKADPKSKARTMVSRSGGAVIGSLLGGLLATWLGRRFAYFLISLLSLCVSSWIFGWLNPLHPWFLWASFTLGLVGTTYFGWLPLYLPELFPTRVRAAGTGISFNTGRAVAAVVVLGTGLIVQGFDLRGGIADYPLRSENEHDRFAGLTRRISAMQYRPLGSTGISISAVSFGSGPVSGLLTGDAVETQQAVVQRAVQLGVNWFDTAASYGNGQSEFHLGAALSGMRSDQPLHVATKVRVQLTTQTDLRPLVVSSVKESLSRLKLPRVTLLQIHNSITKNRLDQPTSITPEDVLGPRGLLAGMQEVRAAGWVEHFGLTGIGDAEALCTVMHSQEFATIQAPLHFLNPSALRVTPSELCDPDFGGFLQTAHELGMGIFAIRVFAAGALLGAEPSAHTFKTPFFPLDLYRRDEARVRQLTEHFGSLSRIREVALRYVLSLPEVTSTIIGFGQVSHVEQAARIADEHRLSSEELTALDKLRNMLRGAENDTFVL